MRISAYHRPQTLQDAWRHHANIEGARFIAGGTDLLVRIREGVQQPPALISLRNIPELQGIEMGSTITIGALTPVAAITEHRALSSAYPSVAKGAKVLGSIQIRNLATIGGNLCNASPCADMAPPLLVLDARIRLASPAGSREILLQDFFVAPGKTRLAADEIVTAICFDALPDNAATRFVKKGRVAMDIALVSASVMLQLEGRRCVKARIAVGSAAPRPIRLPQAEALLEGHDLDAALLKKLQATVSQEVSPITDKRATEAYRREVAGVFVRRAATSLLEKATQS